MRAAISFTNLGPYHLARVRALGERLVQTGHSLMVLETASGEKRYPWSTERTEELFEWHTLCPGQQVETVSRSACRAAMSAALEEHDPDILMVAGYIRPECLAALSWAKRRGRGIVLMSESHAADKPRVWWKERIKRARIARFDAALVGGLPHFDYLVSLGMPKTRISFGYNAVDSERIAAEVHRIRAEAQTSPRPYFLAVNRLSPEKNLERLLQAYAEYLQRCRREDAWELVIAGDGPDRTALERFVSSHDLAQHVRFTGFLQQAQLHEAYAHARAFVLASLSEPWGLVVNEAAAAELPLVVSNRAGCASTFVPQAEKSTGRLIDPVDVADIADALAWIASLDEQQRLLMGQRARGVVAVWGPTRFADGALEAIQVASGRAHARRFRHAISR